MIALDLQILATKVLNQVLTAGTETTSQTTTQQAETLEPSTWDETLAAIADSEREYITQSLSGHMASTLTPEQLAAYEADLQAASGADLVTEWNAVFGEGEFEQAFADFLPPPPDGGTERPPPDEEPPPPPPPDETPTEPYNYTTPYTPDYLDYLRERDANREQAMRDSWEARRQAYDDMARRFNEMERQQSRERYEDQIRVRGQTIDAFRVANRTYEQNIQSIQGQQTRYAQAGLGALDLGRPVRTEPTTIVGQPLV
jgi:hypothetical protein